MTPEPSVRRNRAQSRDRAFLLWTACFLRRREPHGARNLSVPRGPYRPTHSPSRAVQRPPSAHAVEYAQSSALAGAHVSPTRVHLPSPWQSKEARQSASLAIVHRPSCAVQRPLSLHWSEPRQSSSLAAMQDPPRAVQSPSTAPPSASPQSP